MEGVFELPQQQVLLDVWQFVHFLDLSLTAVEQSAFGTAAPAGSSADALMPPPIPDVTSMSFPNQGTFAAAVKDGEMRTQGGSTDLLLKQTCE